MSNIHKITIKKYCVLAERLSAYDRTDRKSGHYRKKEIQGSIRLRNIYYSWEEERQEEFLDFCSGVKGVNVLYDFISEAVLDPEATPERLIQVERT